MLRHSILLSLVLSTLPALAQWTTQTVPLRPGWNAVFLEVQPEPRECDAIFAGPPVESAWGWNKRFSPVQFISDPAKLILPSPNWLAWLPAIHPLAAQVNLFILEGGKCYLIKLPDNASPTNWVVRGIPSVRKPEWNSDSFNLVGFHVDPATPPTFQSFFAGATGITATNIYRLGTNGYWQQVTNPTTAKLSYGEGLWIKTVGASDFAGPLTLGLEQRNGLDYGRTLTEQTLRIRNNSTTLKTVTINTLTSTNPPSTAFPDYAGSVPLNYWVLNTRTGGWFRLPSQLITNLSTGQELAFRLEAHRASMNPYTAPVGRDALYQTLLEIKDANSRFLVPVTAKGRQTAVAARAPKEGGGSAASSYAGLWVGGVTLNQVSQPASAVTSNTPVLTASNFNFRILVHVDANGQARLLQKATQMWKPGSYTSATNNPGWSEVGQSGDYVLITDDRYLSGYGYTGSSQRDGRSVGRRFSSAAFGFADPISMAGTPDFLNGALTCTNYTAYTNRLNPFVHRCHPNHDNLDARFSTTLPPGQESFDITRLITLTFTPTNPVGFNDGWGDTRAGGIYAETLRGVHRNDLRVQGTFELRRASDVNILNDGR
jgi:hypothetical protein